MHSSQINNLSFSVFIVCGIKLALVCVRVCIFKSQLCNRITDDDIEKMYMLCISKNPLNKYISHLAVCDSVVVDPHLRVDVFKVPAKTPTLQPLP